MSQQPISRDPATEETLKLTDLVGFETVGIAEELDKRLLMLGGRITTASRSCYHPIGRPVID